MSGFVILLIASHLEFALRNEDHLGASFAAGGTWR